MKIIPVVLLLISSALCQVRTVTRTVKQFGDLELQLSSAEGSGDRKAAEALLADDFEVRKCEQPNRPLPKTEWLDAKREKSKSGETHFQQQAVRMVGDTALYSAQFLEQGDPAKRLFIADVWSRQGNQWKLVERYQCAVNTPTQNDSGSKKKY